jgi:hypothetical protein
VSLATIAERAALQAALEQDRGELRRALGDLQEATVGRLAPRDLVRQRPYPWLGAAAGLGFWWAWRQAPPRL